MNKTDYPWLAEYPSKPDWNMKIEPRLMTDVFEETVSTKPDAQAFDFMGKTQTWQDLSDPVNAFAAGLQKLGVEKGHKVGLFLPNCPNFLIAYYGILKTGATVENYNPLYV